MLGKVITNEEPQQQVGWLVEIQLRF